MIKHTTGISLQQGGSRNVAIPGDAVPANAGPQFISQVGDLAPAAMNIAEGTVEVRNRLGLHIRPSTMVAKAAIKYLSTITIARGNKHASARSATSLEMLKARVGTHLKIRAEGPDAKDALKAVLALFERKFGED
ncbi:MAG: HPr family phosphocarrier protein [Candidatus Binataceae bacterium]